MNNQNILVNVEAVEDMDLTRRNVELLRELVKGQGKIMGFLASQGLDDSKEGETIAECLGEAIRAFDGILPQGVYDKMMSELV